MFVKLTVKMDESTAQSSPIGGFTSHGGGIFDYQLMFLNFDYQYMVFIIRLLHVFFLLKTDLK